MNQIPCRRCRIEILHAVIVGLSFHRAIVRAILLQRLIPVDSGSDLFVYKAPETPISKVYTIRPYLPEDELLVYNVCRKTCLDGSDGTEMFSEYPNLAPERYVLAALHPFYY